MSAPKTPHHALEVRVELDGVVAASRGDQLVEDVDVRHPGFLGHLDAGFRVSLRLQRVPVGFVRPGFPTLDPLIMTLSVPLVRDDRWGIDEDDLGLGRLVGRVCRGDEVDQAVEVVFVPVEWDVLRFALEDGIVGPCGKEMTFAQTYQTISS